MTLRFIDSFDHYATADLGQKYTVSGAPTISANGRRSTSCATYANAGRYLTKSGFTAKQTWVVGFAIYFPGAITTTTYFLAFLDGSTHHGGLLLNTDGTISAYRGTTSSPTTLGTSSSALSSATWYYLECKYKVDDSAGTVEVRIDGSNSGWLNLSSQDTRNGGNATANAVIVGEESGAVATALYIDDLYILDTDGSVNNDFLGDVRVDCYFPSGNGTTSGMTGSDADSTDNYLLVDESSQDGDSTYVESSVAGTTDTYAYADMTHTPATIHGIQTVLVAKKDDAGSRSIARVIRSGGTDYAGTTTALGTSYVANCEIAETDPNTSSAWIKTGFNSAEFGPRVAS